MPGIPRPESRKTYQVFRAAVISTINLYTRALGLFHETYYNPQLTVIIAGSPRSGTTWLAEVIGTKTGYVSVWEPMEPTSRPEVLDLGFGYDPYVESIEDLDKAQLKYVDQFVKPGHLTWQKLHTRPGKRVVKVLDVLADFLYFRRIVVKCVRLNLAIDEIAKAYKCKGIYIIRHPCAVVSSQLKFAWKDPMSWKDRWREILTLKRPDLIPAMENLTKPEEILAFDWSVTNQLRLEMQCDDRVLDVRYAELFYNRVSELERIFAFIGSSLDARALKASYQPSMTTIEASCGDQRNQDTKWMSHLTSEQIASVGNVVKSVSPTLYASYFQ